MFRKLRNKLILINLGVTSVVLVAAFVAIYLVSTRMAEGREPRMSSLSVSVDDNGSAVSFSGDFDGNFRDAVIQTMREERASAAKTLLITLIASGIAIEIVVALVSYFLAEEAIKPVREAYTAQKVFIANASHEIKTPLAAIAANLEAADIQGNHFIDNVAYETERLTKLNGELLTLARTDLMNEGQSQETDLRELVKQTTARFEPRMGKKQLDVKVSLARKVKINAADFEQILVILLDNAVKYSDKRVRVRLSEKELVVENDGKTIAKDDLPRVFERFYQTDKSAEGVGLGLAIAKSLTERNRWKITADSDDKVTRFSLNF